MTKVALTVFFLVVSAIVFAAEADHRFVRLFKFPAALESAVVAEGDLEPRSIGSTGKARSAVECDEPLTNEE